MKKVVLSMLIIGSIIGCKNEDRNNVTPTLKDNVKKEETESAKSGNKYDKLSIDSLMSLYENDKTNKKILHAFLTHHAISREEFLIYSYGFWSNDIKMPFLDYSKSDVAEVAALNDSNHGNDDTDIKYVRYNPSSSHLVNTIKYTPIIKAEWSEITACYPIPLFEAILTNMGDQDILRLTKGFQYIGVPPVDRDDIKCQYQACNVILFELVHFNGDPTEYYDISHDPGN